MDRTLPGRQAALAEALVAADALAAQLASASSSSSSASPPRR